MYVMLNLTLWTIPARARAVYAPLEKPNRQILSPAVSAYSGKGDIYFLVRKEYAQFCMRNSYPSARKISQSARTRFFQPTHNVRMQVPRDHHIQCFGELCHAWCSDLGCNVCSYPGLPGDEQSKARSAWQCIPDSTPSADSCRLS